MITSFFPLSIVLIQASYLCIHLSNLTLMDTELCVYLSAGIFTMIVSVHFHYNQGSKFGAKYDDKLMHTTIVLIESVYNQKGLSPQHISSGPIYLIQKP